MMNKKHIIVTAAITFVVTTVLVLTTVAGGLVMFIMKSGDSSQKMSKIENLIDEFYIYDYDKEKMIDMALSAYAGGVGDPYTAYIDKERFAEMTQELSGDYVGIGVEVFVDEDNLLTVIAPFDDSPASKAGVKPGDKIVKVDGKDVSGKNYTQAVQLIRGNGKSTHVKLTIKRGEKSSEISIKRDTITVDTVKKKMLADNVGYIRISTFGDHTAKEFKNALNRLGEQGAKALVIDVRDNPGGTLKSIIDVSDELLPKCNIMTMRDKNGNEKKYDSKPGQNELPISVIINGNSASAAEAFAGAIADNGRGKLVGTKSFGKGIAQSVFEFGDGTAFKVTTARYFTPGGTCIDKTGITPHVEVELDEEYTNIASVNIPYEYDLQLHKAIEIVKQQIK